MSAKLRNIKLRGAGPSIVDLGFRIWDWKKMDCKLREAECGSLAAGLWNLGPGSSMPSVNSAFINIIYDCSSFICS